MATAADTDLARVYGVSPALIESMRRQQCTEGEHWEHTGTDRRVVWLPEGLDFLPSLLGIAKKEGGAAAPRHTTGEVYLLSILRIYPNPIWVQIHTPDGRTAQVQVRRNERLTPRMKIACRQQTDGRWECTHKGLAVPLKPLASKATTAIAQPQ